MLSSLSFSLPSSAAAVRVEKATSELLIGPDWTMNMEICDSINSHNWLAKDVVKALKKRLQHKNPRVQLLALTLLETMVKNCGDFIHFYIGERKILDQMIKLVKKETDMQVRNKVLVLLDSWQEAFGRPGGKHAQYYWACDELRRAGVQFPPRPVESATVFTLPSHPSPRHSQPSLKMPMNSSRGLDEAMSSQVECLSLSSMKAMRNATDILSDMLRAADSGDRMALKDEVIVDLVDQCRSNQMTLMQMLTTTVDDELLALGLELNDDLQSVLAKHDAIAFGSPLPTHGACSGSQPNESAQSSIKPDDARDTSPASVPNSSVPNASMTKDQVDEEDDEFAQLARRHTKLGPAPSRSVSRESNDDMGSSSISDGTATSKASIMAESNALVSVDPPAPVKTTKELNMINLLGTVLLTTDPSQTTKSSPEENFPRDDGQVPFYNYDAPWAQPQVATQAEHMQQNIQPHLQHRVQQQKQMHFVSQPQQVQVQQPGCTNYYSNYPLPPWAATPGYSNSNTSESAKPHVFSNSMPLQGLESIQQMNSLQNLQSINQLVNPTIQPLHNWYSTPMQEEAKSIQHVNSVQQMNQPAYSTTQSSHYASVQGVRSLRHENPSQNARAANQSTYRPSPTDMNSLAPGGIWPLPHVDSFPSKRSSALAMNGDELMTATPMSTPAGQKPFIPPYGLFEDINVHGSA